MGDVLFLPEPTIRGARITRGFRVRTGAVVLASDVRTNPVELRAIPPRVRK